MNRAEIDAIVRLTSFMDRSFRVMDKDDGWLVQVVYHEADVDTGKMAEQHARKWYVSSHATETEVVETLFAAVCRSMMHVVGEHFTYNGRRVYSPHFDIDARIDVCDDGRFDRREEKKS